MQTGIKLTYRPLIVGIMMLLAAIIMGCDESPPSTELTPKQNKASELSDKNINAYAKQMADNYITIQDQLLKSYQQAKQSNKTYDFIQYRNHKWTPEYISLKTRYSRDFEHNKAFLENHPAAPLFTLYEHLIYIGLDLKNGLLEDDEPRQKAALESAEADKQTAITIKQQLK